MCSSLHSSFFAYHIHENDNIYNKQIYRIVGYLAQMECYGKFKNKIIGKKIVELHRTKLR